MKKKLYYTVQKETEFYDDIEECTGIKYISAYSIEDNIPTEFFTVVASNEDDTEEAINDWLIDNGYGDETFELIAL